MKARSRARYVVVTALACASLAAAALDACDSTPQQAPDVGNVDDTSGPDTADSTDTTETPDTTGTSDTTDTPDTTAASDTAEPPDTTVADTTADASYHLSLGGWTLQPGQEITRCVVVRLGNADTIWVPHIHTQLAKGSHHFVIYKTDDTQERTAPFDCSPFSETLSGGTVPLMITQIRDETLALPPGVAFEMPANQMLRLEAHYLNYYTEPITAQADVTFDTLPKDQPPLVADFLFYGTTAFYLPKGKTVTTPWQYYAVPEGLQVFAMTGHTHQLGTNVEVEYAHSAGDGDPLYPPAGTTFKWSEAPVAWFDPPIAIDGAHGFRFRCTWDNTSNGDVFFGESATQEMCFFWAYYYPSQGFLVRF